MLHLLISLFQVFLWFWVIARIGITGDVFGLGTPLDHPPETVLVWVVRSTILYIK